MTEVEQIQAEQSNGSNHSENGYHVESAPSRKEGEYEAILKGEHLSVIGQELERIPVELGEKYGTQTKQLDLSYNNISTIENLEHFKQITSLVIDNNRLESTQNFPKVIDLQTLWVNNNNVTDLKVFLDCVAKAFPNLTYLSMLKNPACPNYFTGKDYDDYQRYRYYVLHRIKNLKFLDSSPVTPQEKKEANRVGPYMITAKPEVVQSTPVGTDDQQQFAQLPSDLQPEGKGSARFGVTSYVYYGKHSEGNRFILNEHL